MREDLDRLLEDLDSILELTELHAGVPYDATQLTRRLVAVRQIAQGVHCELQGLTRHDHGR